MSKCVICNETTIELLNMPKYPHFIKKENKNVYYNNYLQLSFNYCDKCYHCQLEKSFLESGDNDTPSELHLQLKYFELNKYKSHLQYIKNIIGNENENNVLIITEHFMNNNYHQKSIDEFLDEFSYKIGNKVYKKIIFYKSFDQTYDVINLLSNCKKILNKNGEIVIFTSSNNIIIDKKFHDINSNIVSFFSTNSMKTLCDTEGMVINQIEKFDNHSIYHIGFKGDTIGSSNDVISNLYTDIENELYNDKSYIMFNLKGLFLRSNIQKRLLKLNIDRLQKSESTLIIGYGLCEKSINLLNFTELSNDYIDYFLDFNYPSNTHIPGTNVLINNYWKLFDKDRENNDTYSLVIIINFYNNRINDNTMQLFKNLYRCNIKIIDLMDEI